MRIVIDTNIIISALFFNGKNTQNLIELVNSNPDLFAVANNEILKEYERKITKYKKTDVIPKDREESYSIFYSNLIIGEKKSTVDICRDKDDNKFIECAIDNKCIYIVSGDYDLLSLGKVDDIKIVKVADFLSDYNKNK